MNKNQTYPVAAPGPSRAPQMRQLSLGLFPTAPGRAPTGATPASLAPQFLRQGLRAGDGQRSLPMRAAAADKS